MKSAIVLCEASAPAIFPCYLFWLTPFLFTPCMFPLAVWTVVQHGAALGAVGWMLLQSRGAASHDEIRCLIGG